MALWQVDLHVIDVMDALPNTTGDGWLPPLLSAAKIVHAQQILSEYFGAPWTMADDWFVFGPENGSRVDVIFDSANAASIVARFDLRNEAAQFPALVCRLAQELRCLFFSADLCCLIEPNGATLGVAFDSVQSAAVLRGLNIRPV